VSARLLFGKILGQLLLQLVVPSSRREHVLKMGHEHMAGTCQSSEPRLEFCILLLAQCCWRLSSLYSCRTCQLKARVTYRDRVRIGLIECVTAGLLTVPVLSSLARESQKVEYN